MKKDIKALLLDMDGVLWKNLEPIGDFKANFARIRDLGLQFAFVTNNATRSKSHYVDIFRNFGVQIEEDQFYTSGYTTAKVLKTRWPDGGPLFIVGEEGLQAALIEQGFFHAEEGPVLAVITALDRTISYEKLSKATLHIRNGAPLYGTNPDPTLPAPEGLLPGAGAIISSLETSGGVEAIIIGKPQPAMLLTAVDDLGIGPQQVLMVGDRLETDIAAGHYAGCQTALVLSGASSRADLETFPHQPTFIADDLASLLDMLV